MDTELLLIEKDGFKFSRETKNQYKMNFSMENKNFDLRKLIDFKLIKLIYDLNNDIYEKVDMNILNENEAIVTLLMKHFCEDLGLPQKFSYVHMHRFVEERRIWFKSSSIKNIRPEGMPEEAELMKIQELITICNIITPHNIQFSLNIIFDPNTHIPVFAEKMVGLILNKIFKRVKLFMENI